MRQIVVRGVPYRWALTPSDDGLRVVVRGEGRGGGRLFARFSHDILVTPYVVRIAIERGLDAGWLPMSTIDATVHFDEPIVDRRVDVPEPEPLGAREVALLDRISESDDHHARQVYADWLLERGDPQGELIALECLDRPLATGEKARHAELVAMCTDWLGPVGKLVLRPIWQHGLMLGGRLGRANSGVVDAAIGHRAWRTTRSLDARGGFLAVPDLARLVSQPALRDLRDLVTSVPLALELAFTPFEHRRVTRFAALSGRGKPTPAMIVALCERMPALETLVLPSISTTLFTALVAASTARTVVFHDASALRHASRLTDDRLTELVASPWWQSFETPGLELVLRRGADGAWSSLTFRGASAGAYIQGMLVDGVKQLAPDTLIEARCDRTVAPFNDRRFVAALEAALVTQPRARLG